uniref:receptor protein-tyrosine kinase n=1 Tax=Branchiostoma floridae TaxID=7739 RepID=C3ZD74_BRAFL|eukprot:XP_002593418.1 hypothetical protein BRAFLDRAFT_119545 [Branchiostoma floridae]
MTTRVPTGAPEWQNSHHNSHVSAFAGVTVRLRCAATGNPRPIITWQKDFRDVHEQDRPQGFRINNKRWSLVMDSVEPSDEGTYTCLVTNGYGTLSRNFELFVREHVDSRPTLVPGVLQNQTAVVGSTAEFQCQIHTIGADTAPVHMQWLKHNMVNGSYVSITDRTTVIKEDTTDAEGDLKKLILTNVTEKDAGQYTCMVANSMGFTYDHAWLTVQPGICEPITMPLCKDLDYTTASFPNHLGHVKQEDAGLEVHQFFPLVKVVCSPYLQKFLCSMYAPPCNLRGNSKPLRPCRSLCVAARSGCESLMNKFGFRWPESLECDSLPTTDEEICFGHIHSPSPSLPTSSPELTVKPGICEPITIPLCKDLEYTTASFPNHLGHVNQDDAGREVNQHYPLVEYQCSPYLKGFLCSMYAPPCNLQGNSKPLRPCKSLCQAARTGCENVMIEFGFSWPESLECDSLPTTDEEKCFGDIHSSHPSLPTPSPPPPSPPPFSRSSPPSSVVLATLLRDYDKRDRPDGGQTSIKIGLTPRTALGRNDEDGLFTLHTWISMEWKDLRLNFERFGNQRLEVGVQYLWTPDIYLISGVKADEMPLPLTSEASVFSDGTIRYVVPWTFTVPCRKRPEFKWDCQVVFQSWNKPADEITLSPIDQSLDAEEYNGDLRWDVQSVSADSLITNAGKSRLIFTLLVA